MRAPASASHVTDPSLPPVAQDVPAPPSPLLVGSEPAVVDAWRPASPIPLTGWMERNQFHPLLAAFMAFVVAFLLFQRQFVQSFMRAGIK